MGNDGFISKKKLYTCGTSVVCEITSLNNQTIV